MFRKPGDTTRMTVSFIMKNGFIYLQLVLVAAQGKVESSLTIDYIVYSLQLRSRLCKSNTFLFLNCKFIFKCKVKHHRFVLEAKVTTDKRSKS